ncbi:uncharacterized protein BDZ99DRAFT_421036, partial [Mytilinidion resinicola]
MPKKHNPVFAKPQGSVHPSLEQRPIISHPSAPKTVNERINQLRREQAPRATAERRNEIIDVPGRPQGQVRTRRPPPGPAPPASWLSQSQYAPSEVRKLPAYLRDGISKFGRLATTNDGERKLPRSKSLVDLCLKTLASNWNWLAEFEQHYLPALPAHLKEHLISYLSLYGEEGSPDLKTFKLLFLNETEVDGGTGSSEVKQLDLTCLLSDALTLSDLNKYVSRQRSTVELSHDLKSPPSAPEKLEDDVAESWEDEIDSPHPTSLQPFRFPNLTRLSLAHPGHQASWTALLATCSNLKHLTHLSLAYWPTPSTTPNAATTSMVSKHAKPVALGGSHIYSQLDGDWHEAANILRRLSLVTYRLRWLDLEGCDWYKALTWDSPSYQRALRFPDFFQAPANHSDKDEWDAKNAGIPGPDWNGAWERVETLVLSQGWVPTNIGAIQGLPSSAIAVHLLNWLKKKEEKRKEKAITVWERSLSSSMERVRLSKTPSGITCGHWVEKEKDIRNIEDQIKLLRRASRGLRIRFLHGWGE